MFGDLQEDYFYDGLANDPEVEEFADFAAKALQETCVVAMLLPWSTGQAPHGILCPDSDSEDFLLNSEAIYKATLKKTTVLIPSTFETEEEQEQAKRIVSQFSRLDNVCIIMILLLPRGVQPSQQTNDVILKRHDDLLATGADEVLLEPVRDAISLKQDILLARKTWETNLLRMKLMLDSELDWATCDEAGHCEVEHQNLFWNHVPKTFMPHFPPVDKNFIETEFSVGKYRLILRLPTVKGTVLQAVDDQHKAVAIKLFEKKAVDEPGALEAIYREFRLLSEIIRHPNIARCVEMVNSPSRIYLVFEYAGAQNLYQILKDRHGQRMNESEASNCFEQVVRGVAHLHSKEIAHRSISLHHLVLSNLAGSDREHIRIVDFQTAMLAKKTTTSRTISGTMPYMAPEVALGGPYLPQAADCWSAGVVLLEMAGGLGSLSRSVPFDPRASPASIAPDLLQYFEDPISHTEALATLGAVDTISVIEQLEQLLLPNVHERVPLRTLLPENQPGAEQELLQHEQQRLHEQHLQLYQQMQQQQEQMNQQRPQQQAQQPPQNQPPLNQMPLPIGSGLAPNMGFIANLGPRIDRPN